MDQSIGLAKLGDPNTHSAANHGVASSSDSIISGSGCGSRNVNLPKSAYHRLGNPIITNPSNAFRGEASPRLSTSLKGGLRKRTRK